MRKKTVTEKANFLSWLIVSIIFTLAFCKVYATEPVFYPRPAVVSSIIDVKPENIAEKAANIPVWYEDFDGGLPDGWLNVDETGYVKFSHSYQGPQGGFSVGVPAINSTSAANGFMILDSDLASANRPGGITNAYIQSPAIDLSNQPFVMLSFQHFFRYCCNFQGTQLLVEVSNDGQNWVSFDVKNDVWPNNLSQNAIHQLVNISEVAAGKPKVWIRFRKTGASHYFWMIDDVSINTYTAHDLELFAVTSGAYSMVPGGHQQPVIFTGLVRNVGGNTQSGVRFFADVNTFLFNGQSAVHNQLAPAGSVVMKASSEFTFPGRGLYNIAFKITQNQSDTYPENNIANGRVIITDSIYARDQGVYLGEGVRANPGQAFTTGNIFEVMKDALATSVSVAFHEQTQTGAEITARIFLQQGNSFSLVAQSAPFVVASQHISRLANQEVVFVTIPLGAGVQLNAGGKYLVAVSYNGGLRNLQISSELPQGLPSQGAFTQIGGMWQTESHIPMIRLNLGKNKAECVSFFQINATPAYCGTSNGQATVIPLTGFAPYTFRWNKPPDHAQATATSLGVGQYLVQVWDNSGCHDTVTVNIESQNLEAIFEALPSSCGAPNGQATVIPLAGYEPFTFKWEGLPAMTGPRATGLLPGEYKVVITDKIGCQGTLQVVVGQTQNLMVESKVQNPVCLPDNGSILLQPKGGTGPFKFVWNELPDLKEGLAENLAAGIYQVRVTDKNGCEGQVRIVLEPEMNEITVKSTVVPETCQMRNASIKIEVLGASEPVNFKWNTGASVASLVNIGEGEYNLQVIDAFGCEAKASFKVTNQGQKPDVTTFVVASPGCGQSGGTALVIPKNPNANFNYRWSTGQNVTDLQNLKAGVYYVTVTNPADNCKVEIPVVINDAGAPAMSSVVKPILCYGDFNGGITVSLAGGHQNLEYKWLHGPVGQNLTNLGAGTYIVTVKANECFTSRTFNLTEPSPLWISHQFANLTCHGQTANISVSPRGGTSPYSFYWSTAQVGTQVNNLPAGRYWVQVTDFNECTNKEFITITSPDKIVVEADMVIPDSGKENGSITLRASGGTGQLSFLWNNGKTTQNLSNLPMGTYSVQVTDQNGCTETQSFNLSPSSVSDFDQNGIMFYPNPVRDHGWLSFDNSFGGKIIITVYDVSGRFIREFARDEAVAGQKMQIDLSGISQGAYFLSIQGTELNSRLKFIKH